MKFDIWKSVRESIPIASVITLVSLILSYLASLTNIKITALMSRIPLSSGITPNFGGNVIKFLDGTLQLVGVSGLNLQNVLFTIITVMAIYIGGVLLFGFAENLGFKPKSRIARLTTVLVLGTLLIHLITAWNAGLANLFDLSLLIGLLIYSAIVGFVVIFTSDKIKWLKLALP